MKPRDSVRIRYAKEERIKFISHQDEFRAWERARLRRSAAALQARLQPAAARSSSPRPRRRLHRPARAGRHHLRRRFPCPNCTNGTAAAPLPPGLTVRDLAEVPLKTPALQSQLIGRTTPSVSLPKRTRRSTESRSPPPSNAVLPRCCRRPRSGGSENARANATATTCARSY